MPKWVPVRLSENLTEREWRELGIFKERAREYVATLRSVDCGDISAHFSRSPGDHYEAQTENVPPMADLKALYLDFRLLHAQKEPSNLRRIANHLARRSANPAIKAYLDHVKKSARSEFVECGFFKYNGEAIRGDRLIDLWFNGRLFHTNEEKQHELKLLTEFLSDDLSKALLYMTVRDAGMAAAELHWAIEELSPSNLSIRVPTRFQRENDVSTV